MKVHTQIEHLPVFRNAVLTIGSFDGVHKGHQKIIGQVNQLARNIGGESVLVTFHPHPRTIVYPKEGNVQLLNTLEEKIELLEAFGIDHLVVVPFTIEFSQLSADEYIERFLVGKFHPVIIAIGFDHRFGLGRHGDINFLRWHGKHFGYEVVEIERHDVEDIAVSSTKIRRAVESGDVRRAALLMGHYFTLSGKVVHGKKIGKQMGFPTANIALGDKTKLLPPDGVYAVFVRLKTGHFGGMLYIGSRPTLENKGQQSIEVNIFGWNQAIYGESIVVEFIDFIRGDLKFEHLGQLRKQLLRDQNEVETLLLNAPRLGPKQPVFVSPSVAVVLLNYNGKNYLQTFLPTLLKCSYPQLEVVVADNASEDGSIEWLANEHPGVKIIPLPRNFGFAEGYNQALRKIRADYFVLLNSDVEVTTGWLEPIIKLMEADKTIAAAQPKIRAQRDKSLFEYAGASGGWMDFLGYPFCRGRILSEVEKDEGQYNSVQEVFWASGAAFIVRGDLFHNLGGFDGTYFAHAEEIDLCWRFRRAGYKVVVHPGSVVYHVGGGTLDYLSPFKTYLNFRNTLFTITKNEPATKLLWLLPLRFLLDIAASFLFAAQGRFSHIGAIMKAHLKFIPSIGKVLVNRKRYNKLILRHRISNFPRKAGVYPGSIAWDFYFRGKKRFSELIQP
ncbi:MAG: bifunctional riboflavin kinase/FAD synthetase [Saprospiraceae bacterium]|jgi:riboflavin kinase/FMN adenylyltransferase